MKLSKLILSPLLSIFLAGFVVTHSSWLPSKKTLHAAHRTDARCHAHAADPLTTEAGRRWRNCMPNHWRLYLLQR